MGSALRHSYIVLGGGANLSARLEGFNAFTMTHK